MLKICSFNASGLRNKQKFKSVLKYFKQNKVDIIFLQETHLVQDDRDYVNKIWEGDYHLSGESKNSKGLLTLFSKNVRTENITLIKSAERYIISCVNIEKDKNIILINIYAPNECKERIYF